MLFALVAGLALPGLGGPASGAADAPLLAVDTSDGEYPALDVTLDLADEAPPAHVTLYVPQGFDLYPSRPEGSPIAGAAVFAADSFGSASLLTGHVVAAPNAPGLAAGCGPPARLALWRLELSLVGQRLDLPIAVSAATPAAPTGGGTRLDLCLPQLPGADGALLPIRKLELSFDELTPPGTPGRYLWSAVVTPLAPDHRTPLADKAYEVRALVPVPHRLTLRGRYRAASHTALLTGRLYEGNAPRAGVRVDFVGLVRKVTPTGIRIEDSFAGSTRTSKTGTFELKKRIRTTTGFVAIVHGSLGPCAGAATTPRGCLSTTTAGTASDPVTVSVPSRQH